MRSEFDKELHTMHKELMDMGASCERAIALAASSITNGRPELTDEVRAAEEDIDRAERSIEALCMRLLLRQQPVATDLRNISAALKMISDLERVGDYAMDIVELSPYLSAAQLSGKAHLAEMALAAVDMVKQSVQAFVDGDVQLAARVKEQDDKVDELFDKVKEEAVELIRTGSLEAHAALDLGMAAKYFERIGDHAVNVAEWVTYAHTGAKRSNRFPAKAGPGPAPAPRPVLNAFSSPYSSIFLFLACQRPRSFLRGLSAFFSLQLQRYAAAAFFIVLVGDAH